MMESVVLFPSLGMGHLIPMVELAKLFTRHNLPAAIVLVEPPFPSLSASDSFVSGVSSAHPLISFHRLPKPEPPSSDIFGFFRGSNPAITDFIRTFRRTSNVRALVLDMFCAPTLDAARELRLPTYFFVTGGASSLAVFLYGPTLLSQLDASLNDLGDTPVGIPGLPPIPASHVLDQPREDEAKKRFISEFERLVEADGLIVNTFLELEPRAVRSLVDGLCVPGRILPPIYCVGPLIGERREGSAEKHECLGWLDGQPKGSVVFLCFGSMGSLSAEQLQEIAVGLERSGQRFLWVVRSPNKPFEPMPEPDLSVLMPEGFLARTEGRGVVVKAWAPQAAVLQHESVGGFVTHCGWNSILEAVTAGVPMIAWPLYAEQKINKVWLVEEAKLAAEMEGYDKELVSAEEVEGKVRWLMESEGGGELRDRAAATKESAVAAWEDGGSSDKAWTELMNALQR